MDYHPDYQSNKPNQSDMVRMAKALVAYNWGRTHLFDHLTEQKAAGVDIYDDKMAWLYHENIPEESRNYLRKILWDNHPQMTIDYNEIEDAQWFTFENIKELSHPSIIDGFKLPRADSIARRLVNFWLKNYRG